MSYRVLGLDLSLTCTGLAGLCWTDTIKPHTKLRGPDRLLYIRQQIVTNWLPADLAVVEGPSYGSQAGQSGHHERAGLWWMVRCALRTHGIPVAVIPPASVKKYATGKGNASKADMVREVTRRFPWFEGGEDEADALVLAAMAADHLGAPMADMPRTHRAALDAVQWPEVADSRPATMLRRVDFDTSPEPDLARPVVAEVDCERCAAHLICPTHDAPKLARPVVAPYLPTAATPEGIEDIALPGLEVAL